MSGTEWVGGRVASPLFVDDSGGFQADLIVWLDVTSDRIVAMAAVHPDESDTKVAETLREALAKPVAGPARRPDRIRVAAAHLEKLVAGVSANLPVTVAPTPEIEHLIEHMGETMPNASPHLAAFRAVLRDRREIVSKLLPAMAHLFRAAPWHKLWDSEVLQLDLPELGLLRACVSVMGRAKQTYGLLLFRSAGDYQALCELTEGEGISPPVEFGAEALSLSYTSANELPAFIRREVVALGWELERLDVYPLWFRTLRTGKPRMPSADDLRVLLAMALAVARHVDARGDELVVSPVAPRTTEHRVETDAGTVTARVTSPHPEAAWNAWNGEPPGKQAARPNRRTTRKRRR
jgi:hypothetical protein